MLPEIVRLGVLGTYADTSQYMPPPPGYKVWTSMRTTTVMVKVPLGMVDPARKGMTTVFLVVFVGDWPSAVVALSSIGAPMPKLAHADARPWHCITIVPAMTVKSSFAMPLLSNVWP